MTGTRKAHGTLGIAALVVAAFVLAGCVAGDARFDTSPAGFWHGLWHGIIAPVMLVVGIFSDTARVYEVNNTGGWYDFGFLIGVTSFWGAKHVHGRRNRCAAPDVRSSER
jgi:hypothetical protein